MQELDALYLNQLFVNFSDFQEHLRKELASDKLEKKEIMLRERKLQQLNNLINATLKLKQILLSYIKVALLILCYMKLYTLLL